MNDFTAKKPALARMPLSIGLAGPPGGGKTKSALRLAAGMQRVRPGPIVVIDTEARRAVRYYKGPHNPNGYEFLHVDFRPPYEPKLFLEAIRAQLGMSPAAIIVDSLSDEHEGEGGYLQMHDDDVPKSGGNEWAAWKRPSASRRQLVSGFQRIDVPLIFTFRAREKTKQVGRKVEKIGYQPVAPAEIVYALDLMCLLPPNAQGRARWSASTEAESFILKSPEFLQRFLRDGEVLNEDLGEELARWALGDDAPPRAGEKRPRTLEERVDDYIAAVNSKGRRADGADDLENGLDDFRKWQMQENISKFISGIRDGDRPDLLERIVTANARRVEQLTPPDPEPEPEVDDRSQDLDDDFDDREGDLDEDVQSLMDRDRE